MKTFKQMTDDRLRALCWNPDAGMSRLLSPRKPLRPRMAAVLAMTLALLTATALAVGLRMSRQVEVKRIARETVMQTYGLDSKSLGMFPEHASEKDGTWTVTYGGLWKTDEAGVYTVTVRSDGTAEASWSLEGQPHAWGQKEIAAYVEQKESAMREMQASEALATISTPEPLPAPAPIPGAAYTQAQAIETANMEMKTRYGFGEKGLSQFDVVAGFADGTWTVEYTIFGWRWPDGYLDEKAGQYTIQIEDGTGRILGSQWSLENIDPGQYSRETLGSAKTYNGERMAWVAEILEVRAEALAPYETLPGATPTEVLADLDQLMIDHGFSAERYNHVKPAQGDLTLEEATRLAILAIESQFGVKAEAVENSVCAYADLTQEEKHRQWYFWFQDLTTLQMGWQVTLNAQTGEIIDLTEETFALGNG